MVAIASTEYLEVLPDDTNINSSLVKTYGSNNHSFGASPDESNRDSLLLKPDGSNNEYLVVLPD